MALIKSIIRPQRLHLPVPSFLTLPRGYWCHHYSGWATRKWKFKEEAGGIITCTKREVVVWAGSTAKPRGIRSSPFWINMRLNRNIWEQSTSGSLLVWQQPTWVKCVIVLDSNTFLWFSGVKKPMKLQTSPSDPLGWLNCIRQDQSSTGNYLNPKQLFIRPRSDWLVD